MKKIAITGGIASGKTAVCRILEKHGACTLYSDDIIHHLLKEDPLTKQSVLTLLGPDILTDGEIDRKKIGEIVFNDEEKLKGLEKILHPKLLEKIEARYQEVKKENNDFLFVVEIPLVQEIGKEKDFDFIIIIYAEEALAKARFKEKGFSEEMYDKRMKRQWSPLRKVKEGDYVIENNGTLKDLEKNTLELMKEINAT